MSSVVVATSGVVVAVCSGSGVDENEMIRLMKNTEPVVRPCAMMVSPVWMSVSVSVLYVLVCIVSRCLMLRLYSCSPVSSDPFA